MAFELTSDEAALRARASDLGRQALADVAARGSPGRVNRPLVRALSEHGLLGRLFPTRVGGVQDRDVTAMELCLLREGLAQGSVEAETALAMQGLGGYPILQAGSAELVDRWVRRIAEGDAVAAFALTEPEAGSDAGALQLRADPDDEDGWRLTGEKTWISNAPDADVYVVFARTTEGAGAKGVTAFVVPGDARGLSGEPLEVLGDHPSGRP